MPGYSTNQPGDYFAIGKQSAKDTEATTFLFLKHKDGTALELDEDVVSEREGGDGQEVAFRYKRMIKMDGAANGNARSNLSLYGFAGVLGAKSGTPEVASAANGIPTGCQRTELIPAATLPYWTVEQKFSDQIERVSNAKITTLDLEAEAGSPARLSFAVIGGGTPYRRNAAASALTATRESVDPVFFPRGSYVLNGAGNTKITKFKFSAKRNVDDGIQTTELFREDVIELNADYDLDLTLKYEGATLYDAIKYGGGTVVPLALATGSFRAVMRNTSEDATATTFRQLDLSLPQLHFVGAKVNKLDPDGKTVYIDVAAMTYASPTTSVIARVVHASQANIV
jgi:hypothetical protein